MKRSWIVAGLALAGLAGFGLAIVRSTLEAERTTATRLSPDEVFRVSLVERDFSAVDRNFAIRLEDLRDHQQTILFSSPDEGGPYGTERLIWSKDGTKILLVGRHFFVKEDFFLDNGDQLYFLHDLTSGKAWCNSTETKLSPLLADLVRGVEFTEPVVMKGE